MVVLLGRSTIDIMLFFSRILFIGHKAQDFYGLKMGSLTPGFLHNMARSRNHRYKISAIMNDLGNVLTDNNIITYSFSDFYSKLQTYTQSTSVLDLNDALPNDYKSLVEDNKEWLIRPVTVNEVYSTLKSMPKGKSDALTVEFYMFYWEDVRDSLVKVISHFFQTATFQLPGARLMLF